MSWQNDPVEGAAKPWDKDPVTGPSPRDALRVAVKVNPDQAAEAASLAKRYNAPDDLMLRNLQDMKLQLAVEKADKDINLGGSEVLRRYFTTSSFASMSHDDINSLLGVDYGIRQFGEWKPWTGPKPTFTSVLSGLAKSPGQGFRAAKEGLSLQMSDAMDALGLLPENEATRANRVRRAAQASGASAFTTPEFESSLAKGVYGGASSLLRTAPGLALSVATRSPTPMLAAAGLQTEGESYAKYRARGASPGMATAGAVGEAAVEVGTELLPSKFLTNALGKVGVRDFVGGLLAREIPGEQLATVLQDAIDTATANPDKTWQQYLDERPDAAFQTLVATVTQSALMGGVSSAVRRLSREQETVDQSEQHGEQLAKLFAAATASKLRERSPETFAQFVQEAADDNDAAPSSVFIDGRALAEVFNQSGITDEQVGELMPSIPAQMAAAFESGGSVEIPIGEALAAIPGSVFEQSLMEHIRPSAQALSRAEIKQAASQTEGLKAETDRLMTEALTTAEAQDSADRVGANILDQLNAVGRNTPDVNANYAAMVKAFYAATSARLGVTPEELYDRFPLRVTGETVGNVLEQASPETPEFKQWFGDSKVVDAESKPLVVYHGTKPGLKVEAFDPEAAPVTQEEGVWFTADVGQAQSYSYANGARSGNYNIVRTFLRITDPLILDPWAVAAEVADQSGEPAPSSWREVADLIQYVDWVQEEIKSAKAAGHDGVIVRRAGDAPGSGNGLADHYFVFRPEQIKSATGNRGTFDPNDPSILNQEARGTYNPATLTISLLQAANLSTFLHESGHAYLEIMAGIAMQPKAPAEVAEDFGKVLKWFGLKDEKDGPTAAQQWATMSLDEKRPMHERWAQSFEQYLLEGKAPSLELRAPFQRFRSWMLQVYKSLKSFTTGFSPKLSAEVREVFDRLLATQEQIAEAEEQSRYEAIYRSAEEAGMDENEWAVYQEMHKEGTDLALDQLQAKSIGDMKWATEARSKALRKARADVKDKRDAMRAEIEAEVMASPLEQARAYIKTKRQSTPEQKEAAAEWKAQRKAAFDQALAEGKAALAAENPEVKGIAKGQLFAKHKKALDNQAEAKALAWEAANPKPSAALPDVQMDQIAEQFGFSSGDELARTMLEQPEAKDLIEAETDRQLLETYGEMVTPAGIEHAASEAVHNEARGRFVATELAAMQKAMSQTAQVGTSATGRPVSVNVMVQAAKSFAESIVARTKIIDLKPSRYTAAETRAAAAVQKAMLAGKTAEAIAAQRDRLLNLHAAKETMAAQAEAKKALDYLKKFDKDTIRAKIPKDYLDQIDSVLEGFDLRASTGRTAIQRANALQAWVKSQNDLGIDPILPDDVLARMGQVSYKTLTVEEFTGMVDTVKQIEHLGRLKGRLLAAKDKRDFDVIADEIAQSIRDNGGAVLPVKLEPDGWVKKTAKGFWADHRKLNSLIHQMDGGKDNGPFYRAMVRSMNDAGTKESVMTEQATEALAKIYAPVLALKGGVSGDVKFIPEINASLSRGGRLAIALNWGNEQNQQRVKSGDGWNDQQAQAIIKTLSPTELQFVNDVWAYIDSFWPEIQAKQERVTGVAEEKVQAVPFDQIASDGTVVKMRGGYYPIKYDSDRSMKAERNEAVERAAEIMRGAVARPTTRRGHTKARVEEVKGRPIRKDLAAITQHVNQVVHDLAWHEWVIDANRLLNDNRINAAVREHYGNDTARTMREAADAIAVGDAIHQHAADRILLMLRSNVTRSIMGASLTTALLQPFGLTQSMARIGVMPVLRGAGRWAGDAARMESTVGWIQEKSEFMRLRGKTFNRELREISQRVDGKSKTMQIVDASLFMLMQKLQMVADVPTWVGAYEKALAGGVDESGAVALADEAVLSSQGGGTIKDLAGVQRNMPFLTQFYSYFNTTMNLVVEKTGTTDFKDPKAVAGWLADMALLTVIPAILPALVTHLLKGGGEDDEPDEWAKRIAGWQASYLLGMFVGLRELPAIWSPFDYQGPPAGKIVNDAKKLAQQSAQGEVDEPLVLAAINFMGTSLGLPTVQLLRSYKGWKAWSDGDAPASSILFGPPPKS